MDGDEGDGVTRRRWYVASEGVTVRPTDRMSDETTGDGDGEVPKRTMQKCDVSR